MEKEKINRINQLAKLSKERALTAEEKSEQQELRKEFIKEIRADVRSQLESIEIVDEVQQNGLPMRQSILLYKLFFSRLRLFLHSLQCSGQLIRT